MLDSHVPHIIHFYILKSWIPYLKYEVFRRYQKANHVCETFCFSVRYGNIAGSFYDVCSLFMIQIVLSREKVLFFQMS